MNKTFTCLLGVGICFSAVADLADFFQERVDEYFSSHGISLSTGSETVLSSWLPPESIILSNEVSQVVVSDDTWPETNGVPASINILSTNTEVLASVRVSAFETKRDAWTSLAMEIVASSLYYADGFDKYSSTNLTDACSVFLPLVRESGNDPYPDPTSATLLSRNLRIDIHSTVPYALDIATAFAGSLSGTNSLSNE